MPLRLKEYEVFNPEVKQELIDKSVTALDQIGEVNLKRFLGYIEGQLEHERYRFEQELSADPTSPEANPNEHRGRIATLVTLQAGIESALVDKGAGDEPTETTDTNEPGWSTTE